MTTIENFNTATELRCHSCDYDLRAHRQAERCPECAALVAESRRLAAIPLRPAWRDSDPRWRRRMLAGLWMLVLMPLMEVLRVSGVTSDVRVPNCLNLQGSMTLQETMFGSFDLLNSIFFCIGMVLLFADEKKRRLRRSDWTRRWGIICCYVISLLVAVPILFISALVMGGIAALFQSMPLRFQPGVTNLFVLISTTYLRYGPHPKGYSDLLSIVVSAIAVLLVYSPLVDALRSVGLKRLALILPAPLALFAIVQIAQAGWFWIGSSSWGYQEVYSYAVYFRSNILVHDVATASTHLSNPQSLLGGSLVELAKWCTVLAIALCLSVAQIASWVRRPAGVGDGAQQLRSA